MRQKESDTKILFMIFLMCIIMTIVSICSAFYARHQNDKNYAKALKCMEEEDFGEAVLLLEKCGQYKDAKDIKKKAEEGLQYIIGIECINDGEFQKGIDMIQDSGYQYDKNIIKKAHYLLGMDLYKQRKYQDASLQFIYAKDYKDATAYDIACSYKNAKTNNKLLYTAGKIYYKQHNYKDAFACFIATGNYKNSAKWKIKSRNKYMENK